MNFSLPWVFSRRMDRSTFWLRTSYWTGAFAGLVAALRTILPPPFPLPEKAGFPISSYVAGSFFLGWSLLLIWADRRPQKRKSVLLLTLFSVLTGWAASEVYAVFSTGLSDDARLPFWFLQGGLFLLFTFSYLQARRTYPRWWRRRA